jgi:hypothetical protein
VRAPGDVVLESSIHSNLKFLYSLFRYSPKYDLMTSLRLLLLASSFRTVLDF